MRMRALFLFLILPALLLVAAQDASAEGSVAVVDMVRVINEHPEMRRLNEEVGRRQDAIDQQSEAALNALKQIKDQIERMPDTPERRLKMRDYDMRLATAEFTRKRDIQNMRDWYVDGLESIYNSVRRRISSYARQNGIILVLLMTPSDKLLRARTDREFEQGVVDRVVVHYDESLDITERILALTRGGVGRPPAPPAGTPRQPGR